MRRGLLLSGVFLCVAVMPMVGRGDEPKKVQVLVKSWLLPGTLASELKAGKPITAVEVEGAEATKVELSEVVKGKDERPMKGTYHQQKITVFKGNKYANHDAYFSTALPKGTKLKDFTYKGTFTGKVAGETHKFTYFEATPVRP
jgi:hypothetical protein